MLKYLTLGVHDVVAAGKFYDALLKPIGFVRLKTMDHEIGYGPPGGEAVLWALRPNNKLPATYGNGTMIALQAPSRQAVDAFHEIALANGGYDEGKPGIRGGEGSNWYACYVRDPAGNKLSAVYDKPV
jgi:catechol 2,3-dioxygenase-like lactoylglutathione lyase family enzyme